MSNELELLANRTIEPFVLLFNKSVELIPGILVALLMLFLGLFLSKWASALTTKILNAFKVDDWSSKIGLNELLSRIGFGKSPVFVVAFVISWTVMIAFIMIAADALGLQTIKDLLYGFLAFIPKILAAVVILFAGLIFGRFVQKIVANSAEANKIKGGGFVAKSVNIIIVMFACLMALEQVNIQFALINDVIIIVLASIGLAFAIAFGLGSKTLVEDFLKETFKK